MQADLRNGLVHLPRVEVGAAGVHLAQTCRRWQAAGILGVDADPDAVAELLLSVILGFIAQRSLAGGASIEAHVTAVTALLRASAG